MSTHKRIVEVSDQTRKLSVDRRSLKIVLSDDTEHLVPFDDLGLLLIDSQRLLLTSALLSRLSAHNIPCLVTNEQHLPEGILLSLGSNSITARRQRLQVKTKKPILKRLWQQIVRQKIEMQGSVLEQLGLESQSPFRNLRQKVKSGDQTNVEAQAARQYWPCLFADTDYRRSSSEDSRNAALNYGYAVLRAIVARSVVAAGLNPVFSIHHSNQYNAFALVDDLMEPFRPCVDIEVVNLARTGALADGLTVHIKEELLSFAFINVEQNSQSVSVPLAVERTVDSLVKCYTENATSLTLPEAYLGHQ